MALLIFFQRAAKKYLFVTPWIDKILKLFFDQSDRDNPKIIIFDSKNYLK